ncbi:MAG: YcaO-like family protein [Bacteriovoracia bacterium]
MQLKDFINKLTLENELNYYIYNDSNHLTLPLSVRLEFKFEDKIFESWGVSQNKDLAFFKALMELIERVVLSKSCSLHFKKSFFSKTQSLNEIATKHCVPCELLYPDNSNGAGMGTSASMAKQSALMELIERHTILSCLYLNIPPKQIEKVPREISLGLDGHRLSFHYWICGKYFVVLAVDQLPNGGFLFTHSCSANVSTAILKSYEEMIPNIIYYEKHPEEHLEVQGITYNDIMSFNRYWKYSGDKDVLSFLMNKHSCKQEGEVPTLKNIYYSSLEVPKSLKFQKGLFCYRAISPEAQQLFFDNWSLRYINPKLRGKGTIPSFPHIIS